MFAEKELKRIYESMNDIIFEGTLPSVYFTLSKGQQIKQRWYVVLRGEKTYNIVVNYQRLFDSVDDIYKNMLHQMIHILCSLYRIKDTCRHEQYHNIKFKKSAEEYGLIMDQQCNNRCGYNTVGIEPQLLEKLHKEIELNVNTFPDALKRDGEVVSDDRRFSFRPMTLVCPKCGQSAMSSPRANIICGDCSEPLVPLSNQKRRENSNPTTLMCPNCKRTIISSPNCNFICGTCFEHFIIKKNKDI